MVALCDVNDLRVKAAKGIVDKVQGGNVPTYRQHEEVLARSDIHGVLIASPEHWHAPLAEEAIKAGKDVYIEKPMTINLKHALRLRKVTRANPEAIVVVGTQFVMMPSYMAAADLIKEGVIARPLPDDVVKSLREATTQVLAEAVAKDPLTKKVHTSYMAFKAKYDSWAGYSEAVYHARIRGA